MELITSGGGGQSDNGSDNGRDTRTGPDEKWALLPRRGKEDSTSKASDIEAVKPSNGNVDLSDEDGTSEDSYYLRPSTSSWLRLLAFFLSSVVTGGITNGQDVFNRLFAEAGLIRSACPDGTTTPTCPEQYLVIANIMTVLALCSFGLFLPAGILFDAYGGRVTSVFGCAVMIGGLSVLVFLLSVPSVGAGSGSSVEVPLFVLAVLLVDAGSYCINVSFLAFLWHVPGHHAFVASLSNCCYAVSSLLPLIMVRAMVWLSLDLDGAFVMYGIAVAGCAWICWLVVPSEAEYISRASRVLGVPIPRKRGITWRKVKQGVEGGVQVLAMRKVAHCSMTALCSLAYLTPFFYMTLAVPLGDELFGAGQGNRLGELFNSVNGITGLFLGPLLGVLADHLRSPADGLFELAVVNSAALLSVAALCGVASWWAQIVALVSTCATYQAMLLYLVRYVILFSPPHRVGTVQGIAAFSFALLDIPVIVGMSFGLASGAFSYARSTLVVSAAGGGCWAVYSYLLRTHPPWPDAPEFTKEDERKVSKPFLVGTISDAAYVLDLPRERFLRLAASSNVLDQRRLFELAAEESAERRLLDMAKRRCPVPPLPPPSSRYAIPDIVGGRSSDAVVVFGTGDTSAPSIDKAFNGHGHDGKHGRSRTEPLFQWVFEPLGVPPEHPKRIQLTQFICSPLLYVAEAYGVLIEARVPDPEGGAPLVAAACAAFPPGSLAHHSAMPIGHERWFYGISKSGVRIMPVDAAVRESGTGRRLAAMSELHKSDRIRARGAGGGTNRMWYVNVVGTHPSCQGRGYSSHLLAVVAKWADADRAECYLECSEDNLSFYNKCGYKAVWKRELSDLETGGRSMTVCGAARPPSK